MPYKPSLRHPHTAVLPWLYDQGRNVVEKGVHTWYIAKVWWWSREEVNKWCGFKGAVKKRGMYRIGVSGTGAVLY